MTIKAGARSVSPSKATVSLQDHTHFPSRKEEGAGVAFAPPPFPVHFLQVAPGLLYTSHFQNLVIGLLLSCKGGWEKESMTRSHVPTKEPASKEDRKNRLLGLAATILFVIVSFVSILHPKLLECKIYSNSSGVSTKDR